MPSNVTRDGDTVTVRSCGEPDDMAEIYPDEGVYLLNLSSSTGLLMLDTADLAALAYELLALAGEPDWRAEVEALRSRAERLRVVVKNTLSNRQRARLIQVGVLQRSDLADDLRTLDELPPLKLADNPRDVSRAELPQNER